MDKLHSRRAETRMRTSRLLIVSLIALSVRASLSSEEAAPDIYIPFKAPDDYELYVHFVPMFGSQDPQDPQELFPEGHQVEVHIVKDDGTDFSDGEAPPPVYIPPQEVSTWAQSGRVPPGPDGFVTVCRAPPGSAPPGSCRFKLVFPGVVDQLGAPSSLVTVNRLVVFDGWIEPDVGQRGVTGDLVPNSNGWMGHYVSRKATGGNVVLKAVVVPSGLDFSELFEWVNASPVSGAPNKAKVPRENAGVTDVMLNVKYSNPPCISDSMYVWIVWAEFGGRVPTKWGHVEGTVRVDPDGDGPRPEEDWKTPRTRLHRWVATISPNSIFTGSETSGDVPALSGPNTRPPPGNPNGAEKRWDISMRIRTKLTNSAPPTMMRNDYYGVPTHRVGLDAKATSFPIPAVVIVSYPSDVTEGNDDPHTTDEDSNPYSDQEAIPALGAPDPTDNPKPAVGQVSIADECLSPYVRRYAAQINETVQVRNQFDTFVRVQIGDSSEAGYRNWYRISAPEDDKSNWQVLNEYEDFGGGTFLWRGTIYSSNNNDWQ